jgi:broad specificity phosphatase PhoE
MGIVADRRGETMKGIHERVKKALEMIIRQADEEGLDTIILCTHAATNIALGRALTGDPDVLSWGNGLMIGRSTNWNCIGRGVCSRYQGFKVVGMYSKWR